MLDIPRSEWLEPATKGDLLLLQSHLELELVPVLGGRSVGQQQFGKGLHADDNGTPGRGVRRDLYATKRRV